MDKCSHADILSFRGECFMCLKAENAKLKEALQEIAERDPVDHTDISPDIAQAALVEGKE